MARLVAHQGNFQFYDVMTPSFTLDLVISLVRRYKRLLGVALFLGVLLTASRPGCGLSQQLIMQIARHDIPADIVRVPSGSESD
jgi:hypothetical protein